MQLRFKILKEFEADSAPPSLCFVMDFGKRSKEVYRMSTTQTPCMAGVARFTTSPRMVAWLSEVNCRLRRICPKVMRAMRNQSHGDGTSLSKTKPKRATQPRAVAAKRTW